MSGIQNKLNNGLEKLDTKYDFGETDKKPDESVHWGQNGDISNSSKISSRVNNLRRSPKYPCVKTDDNCS